MAFLSEGSVATCVRVGDRLPHVFERPLSGIRPIEMDRGRRVLGLEPEGWGMGNHESLWNWGQDAELRS